MFKVCQKRNKEEGKNMIEVGRLCVKTAGRDAGLKCVIVEVVDKNYAIIDGQTRRKKCNMAHLEPLKDSIKIKKGASRSEIIKEFDKLGIKIKDKKSKKPKQRPVRKRKSTKKEESPKK